MKVRKATAFESATVSHEEQTMRSIVRIDMSAVINDGGILEVSNDEEIIISFPSAALNCDEIVGRMIAMKLSPENIDSVVDNLHADINQRMFKRYIK